MFLNVVSHSFINTIVIKGGGDKTVVNWKLDLARKGEHKIFEPYKKAIIDLLLEADKALGSGAVWKAVNEGGIKISRASVVFFLNFMVDDGLCTFEDATGKGGHHRLYRIFDDWEGVKNHIIIRMIEGLGIALDHDMSWALER